MPRVPGLTPFSDDRPDVEKAGAPRPRLRDAGPEQLPPVRPIATPQENYARPARVQDDTLARLTQSLSSLNPALAAFGETFKEDREDDLRSRVAKNYSGLNPSEILEKMKSDPDAQARLGQKLIATYQARGISEQMGREISEKLATEDRDKFDLDGFVTEKRKAAMEAHGANPYFAEQFDKGITPTVSQARTKMAEYKVGQELEKRAETVQSGWLGTVDQGLKSGAKAGDIVKALRGSYDANKGTLGLTYGDQDRMVVGFLDSLREKMESDPANADKYREIAKGLTDGDRTSTDGTKLGTLSTSATLGPQVAQKMAAFERSYGGLKDRSTADDKFGFTAAADEGRLEEKSLKRFFEDPVNKGAMTEQEYRSLLLRNKNAREKNLTALAKEQAERSEREQRNLATDQALDAADKGELWKLQPAKIVGKDGKEAEVSPDDLRSGAVEKFLEREKYQSARELQLLRDENRKGRLGPQPVSEEELAKMAEERSFSRKAAWFARNGEENPEWKTALSRGALSGSSVDQPDNIPAVMLDGFKTYSGLVAKAPQMAWKHADENARQFFDTARVLVESGAMDERRALVIAIDYHRDPSKFDSQTARQRADQVRDRLGKMTGNGLSRLIGWADMPNADRMEDVSTDIQKLAKVYVGAGRMTVEAALKEAGKVAARNFTEINGSAVRTGDRKVPPNFRENAGTFLKRFAEEHPDTPLGELTLKPLPNSATSWMVVDRLSRPAALDGRGIMTLDDLKSIDDLKVAKARLQAEMTSRKRAEQATEKAKEAGKSVERLKAGGVNAPVSPMIEAPTLKKPGDIPPPAM